MDADAQEGQRVLDARLAVLEAEIARLERERGGIAEAFAATPVSAAAGGMLAADELLPIEVP